MQWDYNYKRNTEIADKSYISYTMNINNINLKK